MAEDDDPSDAAWTLPLPGEGGRRQLSHGARRVVAALLRRFDADGDGAWSFVELNAFQAATGDAERLGSAEELVRLFSQHGVPLSEAGALDAASLRALYTLQGPTALRRDVEALWARAGAAATEATAASAVQRAAGMRPSRLALRCSARRTA